MMSEQQELDKLRILFNAVHSLDKEEPDFYGELKQCAWNILHENPGTDFGGWIDKLMLEYPTEVVDALGTDSDRAIQNIRCMWIAAYYEDEDTGECHSLKDWSGIFANDLSTKIYDRLATAERKIMNLEARRTKK